MIQKILIGGVTVAAIVGAGGVALATTGGTTTNGSAASSTHAKHPGRTAGKHGRSHRLLRHLDHADVVLHTRKKGEVDLHLIRGTVSAVSSSSVTVVSADKTSETFTINGDSKIRTRKDGKRADASVADVSTGDRVLVAGVGTGTPVVRRLVDRGTK